MTWPQRFLAVLREIETPLSEVLEADGCREGWLQAELFRRFGKIGLKTNRSVSGVKHDLLCETHSKMVAEIKIYKDDIKRHKKQISTHGSAVWSLGDIEELQPARGSYLSDIRRLMKMQSSKERYMILVLPVDKNRIISNVHVVPREREIEKRFRSFRVRISMLLDE